MQEDVARLVIALETTGFPGLLGVIDCSKWRWKNYRTASDRMYKGKEKAPSGRLEPTADQSLWNWHTFFGMAWCLKDINVVKASPMLE